MKEKLQCTSKYGHLRISQDICHGRMTDIEGFLTIYGHSDNLLNNNIRYPARHRRIIVKYTVRVKGSRVNIELTKVKNVYRLRLGS